jgi:hypothetical protein
MDAVCTECSGVFGVRGPGGGGGHVCDVLDSVLGWHSACNPSGASILCVAVCACRQGAPRYCFGVRASRNPSRGTRATCFGPAQLHFTLR